MKPQASRLPAWPIFESLTLTGSSVNEVTPQFAATHHVPSPPTLTHIPIRAPAAATGRSLTLLLDPLLDRRLSRPQPSHSLLRGRLSNAHSLLRTLSNGTVQDSSISFTSGLLHANSSNVRCYAMTPLLSLILTPTSAGYTARGLVFRRVSPDHRITRSGAAWLFSEPNHNENPPTETRVRHAPSQLSLTF